MPFYFLSFNSSLWSAVPSIENVFVEGTRRLSVEAHQVGIIAVVCLAAEAVSEEEAKVDAFQERVVPKEP